PAAGWPGSRPASARARFRALRASPPRTRRSSSVISRGTSPDLPAGGPDWGSSDRIRPASADESCGSPRLGAPKTGAPFLLWSSVYPQRSWFQREGLTVFDKLGDLASEHAELERALADPGVHADADQARTLAKRYAELTPIVGAYREWLQGGDDEQAARELATEDASFAKEGDGLG